MKTQAKTIQATTKFLSTLILTLALSACGSSAKQQVAATPAGSVSGSGSGSGGSGSGSSTSGGSTSSSTSGSSSSNDQTISFSFDILGDRGGSVSHTWDSPTIDTDSKLIVKISANPASYAVNGTGFVGQYGCARFNVKVLNQMITTKPLAVNGGSPFCKDSSGNAAPTYDTLNFSSRMTAGHAAPVVEISNAAYDFDCLGCMYYAPQAYNAYLYGCSYYCPMRPAFKNHTVSGTIDVTIDQI